MAIPNPTQLLAEGPAQLLDRPLEDYAAFLREARELRPKHLETVDYAVQHSVVRLLARGAGEKELAHTYDSLRRLVPVEREGELSSWSLRWRAFADLLDARLQSLASRDIEKARRLAHASEILSLVAEEPGLSQAEIAERLGLSPNNLSRILGVLEAHELIERRSLGREKQIYGGRLATADYRLDDRLVDEMSPRGDDAKTR